MTEKWRPFWNRIKPINFELQTHVVVTHKGWSQLYRLLDIDRLLSKLFITFQKLHWFCTPTIDIEFIISIAWLNIAVVIITNIKLFANKLARLFEQKQSVPNPRPDNRKHHGPYVAWSLGFFCNKTIAQVSSLTPGVRPGNAWSETVNLSMCVKEPTDRNRLSSH